MVPLVHHRRLLALQHRHDMPGAKALPGAINGRQHLLRRHRAVEQGARPGAVVAVAARPLQRLAEAAQQRAGPARCRLGERDHGLEPLAHHALLSFRGGRHGQPVPRPGNVLAAIQKQRVRPLAVPPGPANLLVERFRAVRHVQVDHVAHIRPVDPHAERDRRHHHDRLARPESAQRHALLHGRQPGMKRHRRQPSTPQPRAHAVRLGSAAAVDDACLPLPPAQEGQQLGRLAFLRLGRHVEVRPVKACGEHFGVRHVQRLEDVRPGARVSRGRQRHAGHAGEPLLQPGQRAVLRPELMPPGGHAVRLVNGDQRNRTP